MHRLVESKGVDNDSGGEECGCTAVLNQEDKISTARITCRKRHVCARLYQHGAQRVRARADNFFLSADAFVAPARRDRISRIENSKRAKSAKLKFSNHETAKAKSSKLLTSQTLLLQFARIRIAFDDRLGCRRSLIGMMLHHWGYEHTRAMCVPNEATTSYAQTPTGRK